MHNVLSRRVLESVPREGTSLPSLSLSTLPGEATAINAPNSVFARHLHSLCVEEAEALRRKTGAEVTVGLVTDSLGSKVVLRQK